MKFRFKPEDFKFIDMSEPKQTCRYGPMDYQAERIAVRAQELLEAHEKTLPRVEYQDDGIILTWVNAPPPLFPKRTGYKALLYNIEPIKESK